MKLNHRNQLFKSLTIAALLAGVSTSGYAQSAGGVSSAPSSDAGSASAAVTEGGVGQELGLETPASDAGLSPLSLLARKPFEITVSVREGFDDNVNTTRTNRQQSFYTNIAAGINYTFGGPRLKLTTNLTGGYTLYTNKAVDNGNRYNGLWDLAAVYTASPQMIITATTNTGYYSQPNVTVPGTSASQQGDYFASSSTIGMTYQWSTRFSTTTSYNFNTIVYVEPALNDNQGRIQQTLSQAFNYLWRPTTTLVTEYRISPTTYFKADLDTLDQYALVGWDQVFSPRLTWNTRLGAQVNLVNNNTDGNSTYFGPYGETGVTYKYGEKSQMSFTARYGTEASGMTDVSQRQSFRSGLGVTHAITPRVIASGGLFYGINYYDQPNVVPDFYENVIDGTLGLSYEFSRHFSTSIGYQFTGVLCPVEEDREYSRNVVFIGLNAKF